MEEKLSRKRKYHIRKRKEKAASRAAVMSLSTKKVRQKKTADLRANLKRSKCKTLIETSSSESIKFGSFNVNGLDIGNAWFIEKLIEERKFDVRVDYKTCILEPSLKP